MKSEILVKVTTPMSLRLEDGDTCVSPTLIDKSLKLYFKSGDRKIINKVLESLIFNLFLIIHTRISEIRSLPHTRFCAYKESSIFNG